MAVMLAMPLSGCIFVNEKPPPTTGTAALVWTFPQNSAASNPNCDQAGIATVKVSIDSGDWISFNCADGQTTSGVSSPTLSIGTHSIVLSAVNSMGYEYYSKTSSLPVSATASVQQYDLDWSVGGATIHWQITDATATTTLSCAQAGITDVYVNFRDGNGDLVYPGAGDKEPCSGLSIVYSFLKPGTFNVFLQANGAGSSVFQSSQATPPSITVSAGVFTTPSQGPTLLLKQVQ
jgi:hypothetical protein